MWRTLAAIALAGGIVGLIDGAQYALFVGPGALTWDQDKYLAAAQMKLDGVKPEEIRKKTGIWWGPDGKPRMEIDDSQARVTGQSGTMGGALEHEGLYRAYPSLRDLPLDLEPAGFFDPGLSGAYHPPRPGATDWVEIQARPSEVKGGLIHELQHAIQQREGFAQGGIPAGATLRDVQLDPKAHEAYRRIMGEAEARAAAARKDLTTAQRGALPPEQSYDVPIGELRRR